MRRPPMSTSCPGAGYICRARSRDIRSNAAPERIAIPISTPITIAVFLSIEMNIVVSSTNCHLSDCADAGAERIAAAAHWPGKGEAQVRAANARRSSGHLAHVRHPGLRPKAARHAGAKRDRILGVAMAYATLDHDTTMAERTES